MKGEVIQKSVRITNHIIERIWVEVNQRITYPIKRVVTIMDDRRMINMDDGVHKYCVSCTEKGVYGWPANIH